MAECPQCNSEIGRATFCGCGWKKYAKYKPGAAAYPNDPDRVKCAHDGCFITAKVKIHTKFGWANLCMEHYEQHYVAQGRATCKRLGLDTPAQQRAYVRNCLKRLYRQREPGDDDEPVPAQREAEEVPF